MALSIATGVVKAILVMIVTPALAKFMRLTTPAEQWCSAAWRAP